MTNDRARTSQASVKFKDTLVDFISPTPEPQWSSEEDSTQNTPRRDGVGNPNAESDVPSASAEDGISTSGYERTSDCDRLESPADDDSLSPSTSYAGIPSEDRFGKSVLESESAECASNNHESVSVNSRSDGEDGQEILEGDLPAENVETDEVGGSERKKSTARPTSGTSRAVKNSLMASKVLSSFGRPASKSGARDMEHPKPKDEGGDASGTGSRRGRAQAARKTVMAARLLGSWNKSTERPRSAEVDAVPGSGNQGLDDLSSGDQRQRGQRSGDQEARDEKAVDQRSVDPSPRDQSPRNQGPARDSVFTKPGGESTETDDMALVECSGRFRMMSVAELTALQRRSNAGTSNRSPETTRATPRPPSTQSPRSPR